MSMDGGRPGLKAKAYERKRRISRRMRQYAETSPLREFFTAGLECDDGLPPSELDGFALDFQIFIAALSIPSAWGAGVELKFRKLGCHRAEGLYYPDHRVLALDLRHPRSFAHEFGHLIDYRAAERTPKGKAPSEEEAFFPFRRLLLERMKRDGQDDPRLFERSGRISWRYFSSPRECFARLFEQLAAEVLPRGTSVVLPPDAYRGDPLFLTAIPPGLIDYFQALLAQTSISREGCQSGASLATASASLRKKSVVIFSTIPSKKGGISWPE